MRLALATAAVLALVVPGIAHARPAPVTWCGHDESSADRVPDLEVSLWAKVRFVYAIPADGADEFASTASGIATDAEWIDEWWQQQDPTRMPRFDRYAFPGCTTTNGDLDIGFVRLPQSGSFYASDAGGDQLYKLEVSLETTFPDAQKTIVYYDGPVSNGKVCGVTAADAKDYGSWAGMAVVFLDSDCNLKPVGGGPSAQVATHELLHDLGANPPEAPHQCPSNPGHPCDSETDVLYPYLGYFSTLDVVTLDYGRDDYYGHNGSWWDTQDSPWLTHLPQYSFSLTAGPHGSISATVGKDTTLPCDNGCSNLVLDNETTVSAIAIPDAGWVIGGWQGGCATHAGSCDIDVTGPTSVNVVFVRAPVDVFVQVRGKGSVTSAPRGVSCSKTCKHTFAAGSKVVLRAAPARGWRFAGWNADCSGTGTCRVTPDGANVIARFVRR